MVVGMVGMVGWVHLVHLLLMSVVVIKIAHQGGPRWRGDGGKPVREWYRALHGNKNSAPLGIGDDVMPKGESDGGAMKVVTYAASRKASMCVWHRAYVDYGSEATPGSCSAYAHQGWRGGVSSE